MPSLKSQFDALRKKQAEMAPSMIPVARKPKKKSAPITDELSLPPDIQEEFEALMIQSRSYGEDAREIKFNRDQVSERLKEICKDYAIMKAVSPAGIRISYFPRTELTISAEKLQKAGVALETIKRCTDKSTTWQVRVSGGDDDEEEG